MRSAPLPIVCDQARDVRPVAVVAARLAASNEIAAVAGPAQVSDPRAQRRVTARGATRSLPGLTAEGALIEQTSQQGVALPKALPLVIAMRLKVVPTDAETIDAEGSRSRNATGHAMNGRRANRRTVIQGDA
jgi:hypothetical protein